MKPNIRPGYRLGVFLSLLAISCGAYAVDALSLQVGVLRREVYTNIYGPHLTNLLTDPKYPNQPDEVGLVSSFEAPSFVADMYGQRISGYVLPPYTGDYTFYLSSDDQGALYLSTDDNPSNKVLIAFEATWSPARSWQSSGTRTNMANISAPIFLEAGKVYYIEAVMKEVGGGDSLGVAWQIPGRDTPMNGDLPITGQYIAIENTPAITLSEALDYSGEFGTGPGEPWIGQANVTMDGVDAAQASAACCEYTSSMWLPVQGPARITFWYKVRTGNANYAELSLWVPEITFQDSFRGDSDWQPYSFIVPRDAIVYWTAYFENADPAHGTGVWVDRVQVEPLAGPGAVDPTFPIVLEWSGPDIDCGPVVSSMAKQSDGKTIIVGLFDRVSGIPRNHIARLLPNGLLDTSFHATSIGQLYGLDRVGLQPDGGIIISGGVSILEGEYSFVIRLHPDGRPDTNFMVRFQPETTYITGMTVQPDGRILLSGSFLFGGRSISNNVARLNANGTLDTSFNSALSGRATIGRTVPQPDGKILVLFNWLYQPPGNSNLIARLNADGSLDPTFQGEIYGRGAYTAAVLPDGQLLVAGKFVEARDGVGFVPCSNMVKLDALGRVDRIFVNGIPELRPNTIEVQRDGKLLVGGTSLAMPAHVLARLQPDGTLDEAFVRGTISPEFGGRSGISSIVPQNDGDLLVGGYFSAYNEQRAYGLVRLQNDTGIPVPARELQENPAVATDGSDYLVVWMDRRYRQSSWTEYDLFGTRVSAAGQVLDPGGIPICTNRLWQSDPAVAFDGTNYLVVWSEIDTNSEWSIRGARVSRAGQVLDPAGITICNYPGLQSNPDVAFNGSVYLVTWNEWRNMFYDGPNLLPTTTAPDIYGTRITPAGQVLDADGFALTREPHGQWSAQISTLYNDFLVVWQDNTLRGARVSQQGIVSAPFTLVGGSNSTPAGAGLSPAGYPMPAWLSWTEIRLKPDNTYLTDVYGARINPSNSVVARTVLATNAGYPNYIAVDRSPASGFWSVWETCAGCATSDVRAAWVPVSSSSGAPRPLVISTNIGPQNQPAISCTSNGCLVVWRDGRNVDPAAWVYDAPFDIYGSILTVTGTVLNAASFLVSSEIQERTDPVITWRTPSSIPYGTPLSPAQLNASASVSGTFTYNPPAGTILSAEAHVLTVIFTPDDPLRFNSASAQVTLNVTRVPLLISADSKVKLAGAPNPPLTATYTGFVAGESPSILDVPVTLSTSATIDSQPGVYVITASGAADANYTIVHSNGFLTVLAATNLPPARDNQEYASTASDGLNFLVVWMDRRSRDSSWNDYDIYAARVSASGQVLDPAGIPICTLPGPQYYPSVAFDGTNYLVVWSDSRDGLGVLDIYGARVSRAGAVLDTNGIQITHGEVAYQPSIAFNGTEYLVTAYAWEHNGVRETTLLGVRVTPMGLVRDMEELVVQTTQIGYPAICVSTGRQSGQWLVAWNRGGDGVAGVFVRANGSISSTMTLVQSGTTWIRGVGAVGTNYFVATTQQRQVAADRYLMDVFGTWITGNGQSSPTILIGPNTNTTPGSHVLSTHYMQEHPAVCALGSDALVAWDSGRIYTNGGNLIERTDIVAARVTPAGVPSPVFAVCSAPGEQAMPALAFNHTSALAVWQDARSAPRNAEYIDRDFDIYGARILLTNAVTPPNGFLISSDTANTVQLTWATPAPIVYGTSLSSAQLNATANVPGTFTYDPPVYTRLPVGTHTLRVTFTPQNSALPVSTAQVVLTVGPAPLTIAADGKSKVVGTQNPKLTATYSGFVWPDWADTLEVPPTLSTMATESSPVGSYPILVSEASDPNYIITRVNAELTVAPAETAPGTYDATFHGSPFNETAIYDIANAGGDRLIVSGNFSEIAGVPRRHIARLLPNGAADPTFVPPATFGEPIVHVLPQPDGKVVIGSEIIQGPSRSYGVARLNADGTVDGSFNAGFKDESVITAFALQADGRILVGGWLTLPDESYGQRVVRLHSNGALDGSFDIRLDGWVCRIIVQPDGRILVGGAFTQVSGEVHEGLIRLLSDGLIDQSFNQDTGARWMETMALQPDGKILVSCQLQNFGDGGDKGLFRLNPDGSLDPSFTPLYPAWITGLALQPDGKIIAGGGFLDDEGEDYFGVVRLRQDGAIDPAFRKSSATGWDPWISTVVLQNSGGVVVGGYFNSLGGISCNSLARLNNDTPRSWVLRDLPAAYMPQAAFTVRLTATPSSNVHVYAVQDRPPAGWLVTNISHAGVFDPVTAQVKFGPHFDAEPRALTYVVVPPPGAFGPQHFQGVGSADGEDTVITGKSTITAGGPHPADVPPVDQQLVIAEVTDYAAAWHSGAVWPRGANPIPVDFVTRAAALWRAGECYRLDAGAPTTALMWAECAPIFTAITKGNVVRDSSTAESALPGTAVAGEPIVVTITTIPASWVTTYAIEDQVPAGWLVTNVSHGGEFDCINNAVKWGPFIDDVPRALHYSAVPPQDGAGRVSFTGAMSCDGSSTAVIGSRTVNIGARLRLWTDATTNGVALEATGGRTYVIETSTDLRTWTPVTEVTGDTATIRLDPPATAQRFYRARRVE